MPSIQNAVNNQEYRSVPITALAESPTNPRKRFDEINRYRINFPSGWKPAKSN